MRKTPRTDIMVSGNSDPSPDEYEDLAEFTRQLEEEAFALQTKLDALRIEASVGEMKESNGRVTWHVFLSRPNDKTKSLFDSLQVYSSDIKGRADYEAARLNHFFGNGPLPCIIDFDVMPTKEDVGQNGKPKLP